MLTTLFSGHTVNLNDIRAVSGVMRQVKSAQPFSYVSLFVEISLRDNVSIQHEAIKLQTFYGNGLEPEQKVKFDSAFDELTRQRDQLVAEWQTWLLSTLNATDKA